MMDMIERMRPLMWSSCGAQLTLWGKALTPLLEKLSLQLESGECHFVFCAKHTVRIVNVLGLNVHKIIDGRIYRLVEVNRVYPSGNIENRQLSVSVVARIPPRWSDFAIMETAMLNQLSVPATCYFISCKSKLEIVQKPSQTFPGIPTVYYLKIMHICLNEGHDIIPTRTSPRPTYEWVALK